MTAASLQYKWIDAFLRAATGLRSVECVARCSSLHLHVNVSRKSHSLLRYSAESFPMDAETDLEAFSNDICETAWGGASLDADAGGSLFLAFAYFASVSLMRCLADSMLAGGVMSPVRGMASGSRSFGRALSVNIDVEESSGSDWDCESNAADDGHVLVSLFFLACK